MYQSFQTPLAQKVVCSSSAGNDASVHLSPSICIKGRNVDVDKFLEFVVAIAQDRHGWSESNILFKDVEDFAKKHHIHLRSKQNRFNVRGLTQNVRELIIPKLRELYPEKMNRLLNQQKKNEKSPLCVYSKKAIEGNTLQANEGQVKILDRVLGGEFYLSTEDEKVLTNFGIDLKVLRLNAQNSQSYQEQMIRVRQKLAFLKLKFHT